jgi:DNA modification methylase
MSNKGPALNQYHLHDARRLKELVRSPLVDVTVTSPPYWDVKDYGSKSQIGFGQSYESYLNDLIGVFDAVWDCTKPKGSLWIIVDSVKKNGKVFLLPFDIAARLSARKERPWHLQDILIWHKPHTLPWSHSAKLQGHFEYILCLSKSRSLSLNLNAIRTTNGLANWWVKYPERYHPLGKSIGNVWEYSIPTQGTWGNGHFAHACPLPIEMLQRIVLLSTSRRSSVVLDPFAGTGATLIAAASLGRSWIGIDTSAAFRKMFSRRLRHETPDATDTRGRSLQSTNLKLRQLKYAVQLYRRIAPAERLTPTEVPLIVVKAGQSLKTPSPVWVRKCRIVFIVSLALSAKRRRSLAAAIAHAQSTPPLSKYQVEALVELRSVSEVDTVLKQLPATQRSRYTQGHFWHATTLEPNRPIRNRSVRLPDVIADISVNERPAY